MLAFIGAADHLHMEPPPILPIAPALYPCPFVMGCAMSFEGNVQAICAHLCQHGIIYNDHESITCPYMGCTKEILWKNIPRHIKECHLCIRWTN